MRLSTLLTVALLPVAAVLAAPAPAPVADDSITPSITPLAVALEEGESAGLVSRKAAQTCKIVGNAGYVNCRYQPTTKAGAIVMYKKGSKEVFSCWKKGECIGGNCTWDWAETYRCFVSGYYTDSNCSRAKLKQCA